MKLKIDRNDRKARMQALTESVRKTGFPSDPMEIARLLGIEDKFAAIGSGRGRRHARARHEVEEDPGFERDMGRA